ncbi:Pyridoxal 5'-phosphate synthase subunit PdxT [Commensalibacter sp. Nvir]|uniref:pyridoxal 5'-phosphate synthase glutaminase subunit PdxT n=1 Tax=Commensalibacter sp. Nvir TaxID=3069817 RepID=UPI002D4F3299|nr:Pyridoxal 5'-phosphate synthase subunit PdxT [Commensalibacter sp. Nvir]
MRKVGVLALQGAVSEHIKSLQRLGTEAIAIKSISDLNSVNGLIIPGGESTSISRLIQEVNLYDPIKEFAHRFPVFGTCAGMILCASSITDNAERLKPLALMDIAVTRNGFGRQIDSFEVNLDINHVGQSIPTVFIRAPYVVSAGADVEILAQFDNKIVMVEQGNMLACAFHPELTNNTQVLNYFLAKIK